MSAPDTSVEDLIGELVAVLAGACADADEQGLRRTRYPEALERRAGDAEARLRPLAAQLARSAHAGDLAGCDLLLSARHSVPDLRALVLLLASAADPGFLEAAPDGTRPGLEAVA